MLELDNADRVIHASSFSKTVSPGVRVGYLVGPAEQIATLSKRANETYISPNMLAESIVCELCRSGGLDENIKVVNAALRERRDALVAALRENIPEAKFVVPEGGYFLWLDLDDDVDTVALLAEAKEEGVTFVAGPDFMIEGGASSLRLSFAPGPGGRRRRGRPAARARPGAHARREERGGLDPVGAQDLAGAAVETQVLGAARVGLPPLSFLCASIARAIDTRRRSAMFRSLIRMLVFGLASICFPCFLSDLLDYTERTDGSKSPPRTSSRG